MIDRATDEFKCDLCEGWFDLPYHSFYKQRVCEDCKYTLEEEVDYAVDEARLHS